jgi:anaerobic ribonucleoside-triphosphate reductase
MATGGFMLPFDQKHPIGNQTQFSIYFHTMSCNGGVATNDWNG